MLRTVNDETNATARVATVTQPWQCGPMTFRLSVATVAVAALTYVTSAATVMVLMSVLGAMIAGHGWTSEPEHDLP